ncbi:carboxyltransferase domain-containing protein, partial [Rhodococcus sp. DSM 6344]|nr:carboxyltransferase domain-containing protein [Rhodococcus erythropolis]
FQKASHAPGKPWSPPGSAPAETADQRERCCPSVRASTHQLGEPRTFEIPVVYGGEHGPDLGDTARFLGVTEAEVVRLHSAAPLVMRCYGSPGGAPMLDGPAFGLPIPRRSSPRPHVAAGSVAVAGRQAVVSARPAPGGWAVIGRTPLILVDPASEQISAYRPGDLFVFRAIDADRWDDFDGRSLLPVGGDPHG